MADPMTSEDEQRIRELLDIHPALLQSEAIEMRRHLLDARDDLTAARAELAAFLPPGALSAGETPALCGTCKKLRCVPGLPGCARCVKVEVERLAEQVRTGVIVDRSDVTSALIPISRYIDRTPDDDTADHLTGVLRRFRAALDPQGAGT